ncbi:MAG TPA: AAA family ATPase [Steroidobacteraceae bacterium]
MSHAISHRFDTFISTKEHRRFIEFANAVRAHRYIGLCYGPAGVGKTLSARRYADCHRIGDLSPAWKDAKPADAKIYAALARSRTLFYTPTIGLSPSALRSNLRIALQDAVERMNKIRRGRRIIDIELIIVDEVERLSAPALECLRDLFDQGDIGLMLVGMPGMEKRMARYPQLYSRVGFAHHYRPLQGDEVSFVLTRHWRKLGLNLDTADFSDTQAIASIARITGGNFRLLHRLFVQIERIQKINDLTFITDEVVNAARSTLVIGAA